MIASLGMYDRPETAAATDRFWDALRDRFRALGIDAPDTLERDAPFWEVWQSPDLLFSQTCGRPFRLKLHEHTQLIGTPDYGLDGCKPGWYRSPFVVRKTDPRTALGEFETAILAYNETMSQSGWAAPQNHAAGLGFQFKKLHQTGGHIASASAVAKGQADIAALDGLTWLLITRHDAFARDLRVLDWTTPTPGLPYITSPNHDTDLLFNATDQSIKSLSSDDRETLGLSGLVKIPTSEYLSVANP